QPAVGFVGLDATGAHPDVDAALVAFVLVRPTTHPPLPRDLLRQCEERVLGVLRGSHDSVLNVSRFAFTSSCLGFSSSARRHSSFAWPRSFRLYAMLPSLK